MKEFKELSQDKNCDIESEVLKYWNDIDLLNKSIELRKDNDTYVFYDGPATANGMPGLHHMIPKILKDTFCKYKVMNGFKVLRKVGWDTHGLPVELQVEKELGFKNKYDIENYGIKEFNIKCKDSVLRNEQAFVELTQKMGQIIDTENPYITYDNNYIETEWWILKKFFDEGLFYEGHKILPYCHRCGTGLASHEVAQGYKEVSVNTVIVPFKLKEEDTYFLVWTTTPWTLISNTGLCVNPKEDYVKVKYEDKYYILAKKLCNKVLGEDYEIVDTYKGKDLEYIKYEQLIPVLKTNKEGFFVTCGDFVTMDDGTGVVHMAPAFGQDDYEIGKKYKLPVLNPVNEEGKYTEGPWKDVVVFEADIEIIKYLKEHNKLFKKEKMQHNYPHCWRCDTPLLYYAKPSFYIKTTAFKEKVIQNNNTVNWFPSFVGEKRFGNWLDNMNDWAISRNRYWGTPLPLWRCTCGCDHMIGSIKELKEMATMNLENIDLHRPYVDNIKLKCPKCGKEMIRVTDVIDCWFDSGSMPFAQYHYPFENKELFETQFPADFISEGIDQTRGWFYTLLLISTFVMGKSPYKNVLVNDLLLDKNGKKMSKSRGNIVRPNDIINEYGADVIRWYLMDVSPVWTPTRFDIDGLKEVNSKFFNTLKNTYTFFKVYANADKIDPRNIKFDYNKCEEIDKWILSKYNKLIKNVTDSYENYDLNKVTHFVSKFVCDDLSNFYIRRNRRRFWESGTSDSKFIVYKVTYDILEGLSRLIAPLVPFTSEVLYRNLTDNVSVHLSDFPKTNTDMIDNKIEEKMDLIIDLISLGRNAREETKIKVRQPIKEVIIDNKYKNIIGDIDSLIKEELNVKNVIYEDDISIYMNLSYKPNYKVCGKLMGKDIKQFEKYLSNISEENIELYNNDNLVISFGENSYKITKDMVDIKISSKEGYNVSMMGNLFIILNAALDEKLINEGIARETISKIQQIRKNLNFDITDRIKVKYNSCKKYELAINENIDMIKEEVLALSFEKADINGDITKVNDFDVMFKVDKTLVK